MAIYKRYNTRRKRINYPLIIWACAILVIFVLTALFGAYLGSRAEGGESYIGGDTHPSGEGETLASVIPHVMQAVYFAPDDLGDVSLEDTSLYVSTWIFKDGESSFATEIERLLGKKVDKKPSLGSLAISSPVSGMFEVRSLYSENAIKGILAEYERAVLSELAASGLDETVLVFGEVTDENYGDVINYAKTLGGGVISVPYTTLYEEYFVKLISLASEAGFTVALMADRLGAEQLALDIENYAVYFTRDFIRLMISGKDASLADVLREKNVLNYQFYS